MLTAQDRIKVTSTTTGTGTFTYGSAVAGFKSPNDYDDAVKRAYTAEEGTAWEVGWGVINKSASTWTRNLVASSTGSLISFGGTQVIWNDAPAFQLQGELYSQQTYITGLIVTKNTGGNTLDISAGYCYDPSSHKIIYYAGATAVNAGTLGATQWNQVYIYDNAGTATIEVVNNADEPTTAYAGTARMGGTNSNRRWIGNFLTTAASNIVAVDIRELGANQIETIYLVATNAAPFRCLSSGTSTTYASVSLVVVPRYAGTEFHACSLFRFATTGNHDMEFELSLDGTIQLASWVQYVELTGFSRVTYWEPYLAGVIYYQVTAGSGVGPQLYIDVVGYRAVR